MLDMMSLYGPHSLENMNYVQKSCLALGIFIQYLEKVSVTGVQNYT